MKLIIIIFVLGYLHAPNDNTRNLIDRELELYENICKAIPIVESDNMHTNKYGRVTLSYKGAVGRWQVMPNTFIWIINKSGCSSLEASDITNEYINRWAGRWYINYLYYQRHRQDWKKAISSYNNGPDSRKFMWDYFNKVTNEIAKAH